MNKLFIFVKGREGLAADELWAGLDRELANLCSGAGARHIRRAAASSRIAGASVPDVAGSDFDGLLELWFPGPGRLDATAGDPVWRGRLDEALARFVAPERVLVLGAQEVLQLDRGAGAVKVVGLARRAERFATHYEWVTYWRDVHSPLLLAIPDVARHYRRYVHNYVTAAAYGTGGQDPPFDGVSEAWFDSVEAYAASVAEPEYQAKVVPDAARFLDLERSQRLVSSERVLFSG